RLPHPGHGVVGDALQRLPPVVAGEGPNRPRLRDAGQWRPRLPDRAAVTEPEEDHSAWNGPRVVGVGAGAIQASRTAPVARSTSSTTTSSAATGPRSTIRPSCTSKRAGRRSRLILRIPPAAAPHADDRVQRRRGEVQRLLGREPRLEERLVELSQQGRQLLEDGAGLLDCVNDLRTLGPRHAPQDARVAAGDQRTSVLALCSSLLRIARPEDEDVPRHAISSTPSAAFSGAAP